MTAELFGLISELRFGVRYVSGPTLPEIRFPRSRVHKHVLMKN